MRKILCFFSCFVIIIGLTGCNVPRYPEETDEEYIISAIGFDNKNGNVLVFAETVVNTGKEDTSSTKTLNAEGETVETALYNLLADSYKSLYLNHCGLLVLGESLNNKQIKEIWNYLFNNKNITQAIEVVCTESSEKLLSLKPMSSAAIGYEISLGIKRNSEYTGIRYKNRFYQIESARNEKRNSYAVPFISVEEKNSKINGLQVYYDDSPIIKMNETTAALYSIITENYNSGEILINNKKYTVDTDLVKYKFDGDKDNLYVEINVKLESDTNIVNAIKDEMYKATACKKDIYGIADKIYKKDRKLWKLIKNDFDGIFKSTEISFLIRGE